ncbi:unnamed protein product [Camellia sinensis]
MSKKTTVVAILKLQPLDRRQFNSLEVFRTLNQCRHTWDSLLSDYKKIKLWESSESRVESYWSIDYERRCEYGFPEDFDFEVFKAIDDHLKVGDGSDTDPDVDPEAVADGVAEPVPKKFAKPGLNVNSSTLLNPEEKFILELVNRNRTWFSTKNWDFVVKYRFYDWGNLKKQRCRVMPQKRSTEERVKPQKRKINKKIMPEQGRVEKRVKPLKHSKNEKILLKNMEEKEHMMAAKLYENAKLITDILKGNLGESSDRLLADLKNVKDSQTDFTSRQSDRLVTCLGNLADTLDQLCDIVQECGYPIYLALVTWINFLQLALFTVISSVKSLR